MNIITLGNKQIQIPGHWNELTATQLICMAKIIHVNTVLEELKLKMLFVFTGMVVLRRPLVVINGNENFWVEYQKKQFLVSAPSLALISTPFLKFFSEREDNSWIVNTTLTRQLLPCFKFGLHHFHGPADGLSNITLREFIFTETFYNDYITTGDPLNIDKVIAVLYRSRGEFKSGSAKYTGDDREQFNDNNIVLRAKAFKALPAETKKAILWYYEGCKRHISTLFPHVFIEGKETAIVKSTFETFMDIVDFLANNQPAEHERVLNVFLYSALKSLNQRIEKLNHVEV